MSEIKGYALMLRSGEISERVIRGISVEGGNELKKILANDPPLFIEVKGRMIARSQIAQLVPIE